MQNNDQLTFQAISAEVEQCGEVLRDYSLKVSEALDHMLEIHRHVVGLQKEQVNLLAKIPGAEK